MSVQIRMVENGLKYKRALDRIVEKYSKLQYQDGGIEVDLNKTNSQEIKYYMRLSKTKLNKLEDKSLVDLRDESLGAEDIAKGPQLDFTHEDGGCDDSCVSSTQFSVADDDGMARSDTSQSATRSLDESLKNLSEMELQPEDQDEALEMSLRSHSNLTELYPSMISRLEQAWHRHQVSEAADSVLRRYRKWRQHPHRGHLNNTFTDTLRQSSLTNVTNKERSSYPMKVHARPWNALKDRQAQQQSPGKAKILLRREQRWPVTLTDFSESFKPRDISLNKTFDVSKQGEVPSTYAATLYPTAEPSMDQSPGFKRVSLAGRSPQTNRSSLFTSQTTDERPDIYSSPVRQSPFKTKMVTSLGRALHNLSRSSQAHSAESCSREPMRPRSTSNCLSFPPQKLAVPLRIHCPQDTHLSFKSHPFSPQSDIAVSAGHHRLRRHHSFDLSMPSSCFSYSAEDLDEDFIRLYHRIVCQNKSSFFNKLPCRFCARNSETNKVRSSSSLAALSLSPHRSLLRKRLREVNGVSHSESKRCREGYYTSSPGSKRHDDEMLRRHLSLSGREWSHDGLCCSPSKRSLLQSFGKKQQSSDKHNETWTRWAHNVPAGELSGLGCHLREDWPTDVSPGKWR